MILFNRAQMTPHKNSLRTLRLQFVPIIRCCLCVIVLLLVFTLTGCNLPGATPLPATNAVAIYTQAAQTVSAQLTGLAPSTPVTAPVETAQATVLPSGQQFTPTVVSSPTASPSPTIEPTTSQPSSQPAKLVFEDDFSEDNNWYTEQNDRFSLELTDGGYKISVNILNAPIWSIRDQTFDDVIVEVDTTRLSGAKSGYSGLVCRHQDEDNYYALVISSDGTYGIAKMKDGEFEFIQEGSDGSGVIKSSAANRVRAECIGKNLSLYANSQLLLQVQDDDFTSGAVGLLAGTRMDGAIEVFFDNFAIYQP
jgi:hypothetical protein